MSFTKQTSLPDPRFQKPPAFGIESPQHQAEVADYLRRKAAQQQSLGETTAALMQLTEPVHTTVEHNK